MGHIDDGYIGSGSYFKNAYKKDKGSFRRRILEYVTGDYLFLISRENYWLNLASRKPHLHYNQKFNSTGLHTYDYNTLEVMGLSKIGRRWYTDGNNDWLLRPTDERVKSLTLGRSCKLGSLGVNSETVWITDGETERKISSDSSIPDGWNLGRTDTLKSKMQAKIVSDETKRRIRDANLGLVKSKEVRDKLSKSKLGRKWYTNGKESKLSHEHPGEGWGPGRK